MFTFDHGLLTHLTERKARGLYRIRRAKETAQGPEIGIEGRRYLNFSSNDYLGLADHPRLKQALQRGLERYGLGSGASHLISGYSRSHQCLEEELAAFVQRPRALVFSTGYMANLGVVSALAGRGDTLIEDRLNHASLIDAAVLSRARLKRYPHVDVEALARLLPTVNHGHTYVLTEGIFSMDGDLAPLPAIASVCKDHHAVLMVDDAHGFGVLGLNGEGSLGHFGLGLEEVPVLMGTFGKALGVFGAFVAGSETLIETLIQKARSYIYTTALPPALAEAIREAMAIVRTERWRCERLGELIRYFKEGARLLGLSLKPSDTAIQPVILGGTAAVLHAARQLEAQGVYVAPIRPPTVPEGTARLRISLTAAHTHDQIDRLLEALDRRQL